jgi:fatty-acyl-CoA synthase
MSAFIDFPIRNLADVVRFESEKTLEERYDARSVYDVFLKSAAQHPDRTALTMLMTGADDETPRLVSYRQLLDGVTRAANFFAAIGGSASGVAYLLPSLVETHFVLWGAETAGYAVPINFLLQADNIADLVRASGATILVALGPHPQLDIWQKALAVKAQLPDLKLVQVSPPNASLSDGAISFAAGLAAHGGETLSFGRARRDDDVAAYFHTGGTTGLPKLVIHTHRNQIAAGFGGTILQGLSETDALTNGLPMFHVAATISCSLSFFIAGANVIVLSPAGMRNPLVIKNYWRIVERYKATIIGGVPTALAALLNVPVDASLASVRYSISGASLLPRAVAETFQAMTGTKIHEILGMTETGGLVSIDPADAEPVLGSVGCRLPYTQVVVRRLAADGSLGEACAPHEIGVMTVAGPNVTPGYRDPTQNAGSLRNGWLDSGDLAYTDEQGRLYIAGRSKDLIIRSGHNIDPQMIENALQAHPAVALAAAVGQPDRYAGELPVCYVALRPNMQAGVDELREFAEPLIAERPAWPKQIVIVDAMPMTSVGKIFKPQLRTDAVRRVVIGDIARVCDPAQVEVDAVTGGKRGMQVTVTLPAGLAGQKDAIEKALDGYLFEHSVRIAAG